MTLAQFFSKFDRPVSRSNHFTPVIALPYFLIDLPNHWNSQSIFVRPFILLMITIATVMWFHSTQKRLVDLRCNRLWVLPISIPLAFYAWAIYQHWASYAFYFTVCVMFGVQLPLLILPSRRILATATTDDSDNTDL